MNASELKLRLAGGARLELAVADDGVAFRQSRFASPDVRYLPPSGALGYLQRRTSNYERAYEPVPLHAATAAYGYPALLRERSGDHVLLTEAGMPPGQAAEHLYARDGTLTTRADEPQRTDVTSCRIAVIGSLATIVGSDLPDACAGPSRIADTSWIRPGRVAWSWWSQGTVSGIESQRRYVDFAAGQGFEYVLLDYGWDASWVPELVGYAASRGVRLLLWTDWHRLEDPATRAQVLDEWAAWGIAGIKVDFLHSDSGARMKVMDDIAAAAAARRLLVDFHGCTVTRGLQRAWPNVLTMEAVHGAEHEKGGLPDDPANNVTLAFTRNVVGSMDFTPVTFSAAGRLSTAAAQLAQSIVFESGLQHYADDPDGYTSRPEALELLREVPAAWDDTRLLAGAPRRSVTLARRSGERWFVGSLSATAARTETVRLGFLDAGRTYTARVYRDGPGDTIAVTEQPVTRSSVLSVPVAASGGFSVAITPAG